MAVRLLHYLFLPEKKNITEDACRHLLKFPCITFSQPPPPPPPLAADHGSSVSPIVVILITVLSSCFLLVSYYAIIVKFCYRWRSPRSAITEDGLQERDAESDHDSVSAANFIWYINTVGLEESVITSITMCKYRRGEGLVDSTDCSVCLAEFRENDDLRLLPKCGHAFHVPCIDTWLTSHVNCPLCRAPIVVSADVDPEPASPQASIIENSHNVTVGLNTNSATDGQSSLGTEDGRRGVLDLEAPLSRAPSSRGYYRMRVLSDVADNHKLDELVTGGEDAQQVWRSVSMDSSAGSMVRLSVADLLPVAMEQLHRETRASAGECSEESMRSGRHSPKYHGGSRRWNKLSRKRPWGGSSMLSRPIAMKRSHSTGGRLLLPIYSKSRNSSSVLPI